jgi:hypothetical protein
LSHSPDRAGKFICVKDEGEEKTSASLLSLR